MEGEDSDSDSGDMNWGGGGINVIHYGRNLRKKENWWGGIYNNGENTEFNMGKSKGDNGGLFHKDEVAKEIGGESLQVVGKSANDMKKSNGNWPLKMNTKANGPFYPNFTIADMEKKLKGVNKEGARRHRANDNVTWRRRERMRQISIRFRGVEVWSSKENERKESPLMRD